MAKLSDAAREKAEGFIIESGFLALFIILKLYNKKTEKDEDIRKDLMNLRQGRKYSNHLGYVNQSLLHHYRKEEQEIITKSQKPDHVDHGDFMSAKTYTIFEAASNFFYFYSSKVEIVRDDKIQEIYFVKMPYTVYLDDADKEKFNLEVDRSTTLIKVKELFNQVDDFTVIMKFAYLLKTVNPVVKVVFNYESFYTLVSFLTVACR